MSKNSKEEYMKRIFITGATGFLGHYIIDELKNDYELIAYGRNADKLKELYSKNVHIFRGDLNNEKALYKAMKKADIVVHAAALSTVWGRFKDFENANVRGTESVIKTCKKAGIKRIIFISSPSIYSAKKDNVNIKEDSAPKKNNLNYYIKTKLICENLIKKSKLDYTILRPRGLFGVGDTSIIPRFIQLSNGDGIPLLNGGKHLADLTCVENVAFAIRLCIENDISIEQIYNVSNGEPMAFYDLVTKLFKELNLEPKFKKINPTLLLAITYIMETFYKIFKIKNEPVLTKYKYNLLRYSQTLSIDKITNELGYKPKLSIDEGIKKYAKYYKEQKS
jgi:DTDP-4-dehydrorhamnose 3,5-epimerase